MTTFADLIDQVIAELYGHTDVPSFGTLVGPVTASSTELAIDFGGQPGASRPLGVIEVDSELMVVTRFDASSGVATIAPWGRGHSSTIATTHDAGARVAVRPRFPRKRVGDVINQVIRSSCPPLFAPRDLDPIQIAAWAEIGYPLPADTTRVLRVDATGPVATFVDDRRILRDWRVRSVAGTQLLELRDCVGLDTIQVTVAAEPGRLAAESDDFAAVTGLNEAAADLVVFGAIARLVTSAELARQQLVSVEANQRADKVPATSGAQISRYYQSLYQQRLLAEQDRLNSQYPITLLRRG